MDEEKEMDEKIESLMTVDEKCKAILTSNLCDDLKIELIAVLKNATDRIYVPYPILQPQVMQPWEQPWWERITCGNSGCRPWGDGYNPTKQAFEDAQADNVMNDKTFYCTQAQIGNRRK